MLPLLFSALAMHWTTQDSDKTSSLRGLSVVSERVVWVSGSHGKVARTVDGGKHWEDRIVSGSEQADFRDVAAFDDNTAFLMAIGAGDASRLYVTRDGGVSFSVSLKNPDPTGFFDAVKFWDRQHGMLLGDPVDGHFTVFITSDGGSTWNKTNQPSALKDEGAFAASGTALALSGGSEAWFGSGGPGGARVFHTKDAGRTWQVTNTPLAGGNASSGIFSIIFLDSQHGLIAGGDYKQPALAAHSLAMTNDGGETWIEPTNLPAGFRSAMTYIRAKNLLVAVGTSGSDCSGDGGRSWKPISKDNLNAVASAGDHVWAVGAKGLILHQ